jgi:ferredoxin-NADP reductase
MGIEAGAAAATRVEVWDPMTDTDLVCIDVHDETHDVKTFTFVSETGKRFDFSAGQFLTFEVELDGTSESRCYSLSSSPRRPETISITVKRVAGGKVSNWLHDNLVPDARIRATGPMGLFRRPEARKYLFISGGSGITPVMSMLRDLADLARPVDIVFLHAGRTPRDLVFREELSWLAGRMKGLRLLFLPETIGNERSWAGLSGRVSREILSISVPDARDRIVMCCGPAQFMTAVRRHVSELGVPDDNYFEESFDAAVIEDAPIVLQENSAGHTYKVEFSKQKRTIDISSNESVLGAAKRAGVRLPSSCSNGLCGTCKSKLTSGSVDMHHSGGIRQREIDAGWFLPCCSKPLGDLTIDR